MRILVADDDEFFQKVVSKILTEARHTVILASTGQEALEKAIAEKPDLIILDVVLPGLLGTEVCQKLRDYTQTAPVPTLLTSSGLAEIEASHCDPREFLADDFILKPFRPETLLERVHRLTGTDPASGGLERGRPPGPAPGVDRRKHPRLPIDVEVTARTAETLLYHPMINISTGGVFLESDRSLPPGEDVELRFTIPGEDGLVAAKGTVMWCQEAKSAQRWGVGVRFTAVSEKSMDSIRRYVSALLTVVRPRGVEKIEVDGPAEKIVPLKIRPK